MRFSTKYITFQKKKEITLNRFYLSCSWGLLLFTFEIKFHLRPSLSVYFLILFHFWTSAERNLQFIDLCKLPYSEKHFFVLCFVLSEKYLLALFLFYWAFINCTLVSPLCVYIIAYVFHFFKTEFCTNLLIYSCLLRRFCVYCH